MEILVSPLGLISRVNPAQVIEAALGKIAAKTGKPFKIKDFDNENDLIEFATRELAKHGMSDKEDMTDPETGRKIRGILTGSRFFMKLHHTAESKGQGRATGGYTAEGTPAKGGSEGAKRVGMLDLGALLSHGAGKVIRDAKMVRGQANPEYWAQFMAGYDPPLPKVPHVYEKFVNQLRASGVNTVRTGTKTHIMALTDKDIDNLAGDREVQNTETVDWKGNLKPIKGGLFDETLTGGHNGNRWAKITLHEPMPNPVMEEPIRRTLGLTEKQFRSVLAGQEKIGDHTGPRAIHEALSKINVPKAIEQAREDIKSGRKTVRDAAVRKLSFLKGADTTGVHPKDWMLTKMAVLPPAFRPVSTMGSKKMPLIDDANYLYKELIDANSTLKESATVFGEAGDERLGVYDTMKAVTGLGDPTHPKNVERNVRGYLSKIFGDSPKFGTMQRKLLSSTVDLVGRAVISPNPDLDMDEVALPEDKAWEIYKPLVVRGLVRRGMPRMNALQAVDDKNKAAFDELHTQMNSKPIIINRAPVLHRYGVMAFYPRLTKNKVMEVSPVITKGFGADFDGDAMQYHVPSTDEAAKEAIEKMLPSKNLFSAANFKAHYVPNKDYQTGVYAASSRINKKSKPRVYRNKKDAISAYRRGEIDVDTPVHIVEDNN
jgi:DNA-directed RNA polymerase beta' subunit